MSHPNQIKPPRSFDPSFIVAAIGTGVFYYIVYQPSMQGSILHRYTTEHAVEHVIVALFIWGVCDVLWKFLSFPREILALRHEWLPPRQGKEPTAAAQQLLHLIAQKPAWLRGSKLGKRLVRALEFVTDKGSADEYREHLLYLAEQDEDQSHANYTLTRFVTGISPVLGFLGTVVHFGTALSGFSADDVTTKLPEIIKEMGSAFNTTAVALTTAMTMMFSLFVCERLERSIVHAITRLLERELLNRFESADPAISPFLAAVKSANETALHEMSSVMAQQVEVWTRGLEELYERFDRRQVHETRGWESALELLQRRLEAHDAGREDQFRQILETVDVRQSEHFEQIQTLLERTAAAKDDFAGLTKALRELAADEGKLVELQAHLADNLRVLRETQQIEDALHGLTGAIHLLTARHRQTGLQDAA